MFTFHHLMYLNKVFNCIKIKVFINTLINTQLYLNTSLNTYTCIYIYIYKLRDWILDIKPLYILQEIKVNLRVSFHYNLNYNMQLNEENNFLDASRQKIIDPCLFSIANASKIKAHFNTIITFPKVIIKYTFSLSIS